MSMIFRRPMFRRGGKVDGRGTGITSGLDSPRQNYVEGGEAMKIYQEIEKQLPPAPKPSLSLGDYLRIASTGAEILGAPGEGGGISGAFRAASKPLSKLGLDLAESIGGSEALAAEQRADKLKTLATIQAGLTEADIRSRGEFEKRDAAFEGLYETKKQKIINNQNLTPEQKQAELATLEQKKASDYEFFVIKGGDVSDFFKLASQNEAISAANSAARKKLDAENIDKSNPEYANKLARYTAEFLAIFTQQFSQQFAKGGMVEANVQETSVMDQEAPADQPIPLTYDELRARLPKEIGDDIVTLLSSSYEALADFAEIRTQADVNSFNQKYQVQLVLPQEA